MIGKKSKGYKAAKNKADKHESARSEWDFQIARSNKSLMFWRVLGTTMSAGFVIVVVFAFVAVSRPALQPYVVSVDESTGNVQFRGALQAQALQPDDAVIRHYLTRFIRGLRVVSTDGVVLRRDFSDLYSLAAGSAQSQLTETIGGWQSSSDDESDANPFAMSNNDIRRDVEFRSFERLSEQTWRVEWFEEVREQGRLVSREPVIGTFSYSNSLPETLEVAEVNPYGVFVTDFYITEPQE